MKLLFVVRGLFPDQIGGSARHSYFLIKHLAKMDVEIDVIHPNENEHFNNRDNIKEINIPYGKSILNYSSRVSDWIDNRLYDIGYSDGLSLIKYVKKRKFPCFFNHHGFHMFQKQYFFRYFLEDFVSAVKDLGLWWPRRQACKYMANHSDYVISLGEGLTNVLHNNLKIPLGKIIEIPNGVEKNIISTKGSGSLNGITFLFVGSLKFRKGLTYLINAIEKLSAEANFIIVGDGPLKSKMDSIENSGLKVLGRISDEELFNLYPKVDCFIFPSLQEGMPTVILEAMANSLPIIASDVGATSTLVSNENGFLISPGNTKEILDAVQTFVNLPHYKRADLGEKSRKIVVENFVWSVIAEEYYNEFDKVIKSPIPPNV